ncbi:hypothetical protein N7462_004153 [Penicillium macrosclerotiorum]|uniref:uncharacterized protein n=1 Tax=Penicillium macrosclerotiorum TaxID=303699 RepID=UPI0025498B80|nr:uncharacterized protein N7462_004153 [Penicillium macrosclerotiorum]KAJ5689761.1 hypothetical protein N7462_004153 [Penicillium macrosclerotiorum]
MDEQLDSALHYGHVGRATYLPEFQEWVFSRSFAQPASIAYTGFTKTAIQSPVHASRRITTKTIQSADKTLIPQTYPDLAAHWSSIHDDSFSEIITTTASLYDPQVSSLLDLGYALDNRNDDTRLRPSPIPIAAVVTGECGNKISFRTLVDDGAELATSTGISALRVPSIGHSETSEWSKRGAPIRQVCFAQSIEEKGTWMAARLSQSTIIFRPTILREPVPMYNGDDDMVALALPLQNSRLDANPVVEIPNSRTGGFPHADVTFNPWYPKQFAIVDTRGCWSIWEISGRHRRRRATWIAECKMNGSLSPRYNQSDPISARHDGWASIEWIADFSTILVSDRRCSMLYQLRGGDVLPSVVELGMCKQSEWILDAQRSAQNTSHFFILTNYRLLWFDISVAPQNDQGLRPPLRSNLSWRHFRDSEDTTLRVSSLLVKDQVNVVVYSKLTELVQVFSCPLLEVDHSQPISLPDPSMLHVPPEPDSLALGKDSQTHFSTLIFREIEHSLAPPGNTFYNPDMSLYKLFWIDSSLAVHESLFQGPDVKRDDESIHAENGQVLRLKKRHYAHRRIRDPDDEDFVVDDWDETIVPQRVGLHQARSRDPADDLQWTLNWTSIYAHSVANINAAADQGDKSRLKITFDHLITEIEKGQAEDSEDWQTSKTILELSPTQPMIEDIDDTAHDITRLISTIVSQTPELPKRWRYMILPAQFSKTFHGLPTLWSKQASGFDFVGTYDQLVEDWLSSISQDIPRLTRVMKERVIRGIALDLLLSQLIRTSQIPKNDFQEPYADGLIDENPPGEKLDTTVSRHPSLHLLSSSHVSSSQLQASQDEHSQVPGKDGSRAPSAPVFSALSALTSIKKPRTLPRNVAALLSHWSLGGDPSVYEWEKTSYLLDEEESQRTARAMTPRRQKKPQKPIGPEAFSLPPTPVAPFIRTWGSQPDQPSTLSLLPSSQPTVDDAPMTQMEPGQFGTREFKRNVKSKKKRRAAGF